MDAKQVERKLVEVLQVIQATSGLECPPINGTTKPAEALPSFDSKMWPVATGMLATELGIEISDDVNLFKKETGNVSLSINDAVAMVMDIINAKGQAANEAVNS